MKVVNRFRIADLGLRIADRGLRIKDFGLRPEDCGLWTERLPDFLRLSLSSLPSPPQINYLHVHE